MDRLARRLGLGDAVVVGLGAMVGAGVFAAFAPAARAAGSALLLGLLAAAVVAYCNAMSSARLAALYPESGGTYVYGRKRLGEFWGYLAGWAFVVGKTASCAAMALTVGAYAWPQHARLVAGAAVVALAALNYRGVHKSALATRVIVAVVLTVLAVAVVSVLVSEHGHAADLEPFGQPDARGVLQAAGFLFFAFAGYARIATLGEEVRDPERTIPRAIPLALAVALAVYACVAVALLVSLGADGIASSSAPLVDAVEGWLQEPVRIGAVLAATGSLLSLMLGVSRTTFAMASDGHLPRTLAAVHPRFRVPHHAELVVALVVVVVVALGDIRGAIGFSSFAVLTYYAVANASAWTLQAGLRARGLPALGVVGCAALALALPASSVLGGLAVLLLGALVYSVRALLDHR